MEAMNYRIENYPGAEAKVTPLEENVRATTNATVQASFQRSRNLTREGEESPGF
jgi:hypothetical protein